MGHEASGTVHAIGTAVTSLKVGDKVAIEPGTPCRRCSACKSGKYNLCPSMSFAADPRPPMTHGTLRKFYKLPEDFCYRLPESIGLDEGVLVEPLAVAVHCARLASVNTGQSVVVFGAGTIGLLCAAVCKALGASKVVSVDVNASRLEFAQKFAGSLPYLPQRSDTAETMASKIQEEHALPDGADVVLEATGVESCIETGIHVLRAGGSFVQAGLGKQKISFPITVLIEKEIHMIGCFRYSAGDYEMAMHLLETKRVNVKDLISSVVPFEGATEAWERTRKGEGIKNLIRGPE